MKKLHLLKMAFLLCALVAGSGSVWADYEELYSADFTSVDNHGYTQNKTFTLDSKSWKSSVSQVAGGVFYLGCNGTNASKGILNDNDDFSDVVTALEAADTPYKNNKATAHAYALLFDNAYSDVTKVNFSWSGGNNAFQVYLFGDSGTGWTKLSSTNYATSGASEAGSVEWTGDATNYTKFVVVARPGATGSTATSKTLRASTFTIYKTKAETGKETSVTINATGITNTDVYTSTIAGKLTASIKDEDEASVSGVVTWSSNDKSVATVGSDGSITLVGAGTATITATYAGETGVYKSSSKTHVLTVTDSNPVAAGSADNPYTVAQAIAKYDLSGNTSNVYVKGIITNIVTNATDLSNGLISFDITDNGANTFRAYRSKNLGNVSFTAYSEIEVGQKVTVYGNLTKYSSTYELGAGCYIISKKSSVKEVGTDGWATYITEDDVEFEPESAFVVAAAGSNVTLSPVTQVPSGTPLILKGEGKKYVSTLAVTPAAPANSLAISDGAGAGTTNDYVLGKKNGVAGFYKWNGGDLSAGKVYLPAAAVSSAREFLGFDFYNETTGIEKTVVNKIADGQYYNLAGQRVAQPTKGLYIVNGKKVIVK